MKLSDAMEQGRKEIPNRVKAKFFEDSSNPKLGACDLGCALYIIDQLPSAVTLAWPFLLNRPLSSLPIKWEETPPSTLEDQIAEANDYDLVSTAEIVSALRETGL